MSRRFFTCCVMLIFSTMGIAAECRLPGATELPFNTRFAGGPRIVDIVTANPLVGTAIFSARDAWDVTDAAGHIGDWNGITTASDCPAGQPFQVGAFGFSGSNCVTNIAYGIDPERVLAYVDYFAWACAQCGTKSLVINLNVAWSLNPLPGQFDIQSVLAHEFGHILGMGHQRDGVCSQAPVPSCDTNFGQETMGASVHTGDTCLRDVEANDIESADGLY